MIVGCVSRTHLKLELLKKLKLKLNKDKIPIMVWCVGRAYKMLKKFDNRWVEYRDPIDLMDHPSNMEIGLCGIKKEPILV